MRFRLGLVTVAAVAAALGIGVPGAVPSSSATLALTVDDDGAQCASPSAATVQGAVDLIPSKGNATITICAGTYSGYVKIDGRGKVSLIGSGNPTLRPPGGSSDAIILATGTKSLTVDGLTIDGAGQFTGPDEKGGILLEDTSATITNTTIQAISNAVPDGSPSFGILLSDYGGGSSKLLATGNTITGVTYDGITVEGPKAKGTLIGNTISGIGTAGATFDAVTAYGISVYDAASAKIQGNTISDNWYGGSVVDYLDRSAGIFVDEASKVAITDGNSLTGNEVGVWIDSYGCCWDGKAAKNTVKGNTITNSKIAVLVSAGYVAGETSSAPVVSGNKVTGNTLSTNVASSTGIWLHLDDPGGSGALAPKLTKNTLSLNTFGGFTDTCIDEGTATKIDSSCVA